MSDCCSDLTGEWVLPEHCEAQTPAGSAKKKATPRVAFFGTVARDRAFELAQGVYQIGDV